MVSAERVVLEIRRGEWLDKMRLKRLEKEDMIHWKGRDLYCYEQSKAYLLELKEEFPQVMQHLVGVIDGSHRNQGAFSFEGRTIPVEDCSRIGLIDWSKAVLVITSDYYREAYDIVLSHLDGRDLPDAIYYYASRETAVEEGYRERYKDSHLENLILFRSGPHASAYVKGMDFADNARALFEYMVAEQFNETYELVWLVKDPSDYRYIEEQYDNVSFLSFDWSVSDVLEERERYYRALCLAKYLFMTDAYGFARNARKDQIRVQLWHGCGFKTRVNFVRCEHRYEYTTVISQLYAKIHQDIYGLRKDQVLVTGYAKEDWLFHPKKGAWETLSVPAGDRYIFWLPTFRTAKTQLSQLNEYELQGQTGLPMVDTFERLGQLDQLLGELGIVLVIKLHPFQDRDRIGKVAMDHIVLLENETLVETDIQINQLLGLADGLISDYSSAAVDYMLLDKPIGFTLEDVEEYGQSRGFVFDNIRDWLPGKELFSYEDLCRFIREIGLGIDPSREKRQKLKTVMHDHGDDGSCRRIVEALHIEV